MRKQEREARFARIVCALRRDPSLTNQQVAERFRMGLEMARKTANRARAAIAEQDRDTGVRIGAGLVLADTLAGGPPYGGHYQGEPGPLVVF